MKRSAFLAAAVVLAVGPAFAATDGTLGATSTGSFTVSASVAPPANPAGARVSGIQDINFGQITGTNGVTSTATQFCLYHSSSTARFMIRQPSLPPLTNMRLTNGTDASVYLSVLFTVTSPGDTPMLIGAEWGEGSYWFNNRVFNRESQDCSTGPKASITATIAPSNSTGAGLLGNYSGAFQMIIAAE
jgi:hypothetical protein